MALSESDIKIIIAAELKKKGFKDAEKATNKLDEGFKRLGGTIATVFSAQQVINFGKQAMKAFVDEEKAAARFEQTLKGVNLGFATPEVERYLDTLEKQTGILKDDLRPAFQTLAQTTRTVYKSQDILATAIDVAAGSGVDLQTVINDLSKSYLGNNASLGKYNLGLTKAELKTTSFEKIQELLNKQFSGQRAAYLQTYAGRLELINVSYDKMQETIGGALLDSFQMLIGDGGIGGATDAMDLFGASAADAIRGVGILISSVQARIPFFDQLQYLSQFPAAMKLLEKLMELGKTQRPLYFPTAGVGKPELDRRERILEEERIKRQKELEALRLKALKAQEKAERDRLKREKEAQQLKRAGTIFDMENIQIIAALQGNIDENQRLRLVALLALNTANADAAEKLSKALMLTQAAALQNVGALVNAKGTVDDLIRDIIKAQAQIALVGTGIENIPQGKNPFANWGTTLQAIIDGLGKIPAAPNPFSAWDNIIAGIQARITQMKNDLQSLGAQTGNQQQQGKTLGSLLTTAQKEFFTYNLALGLTNVAFQGSMLPPDEYAYEFSSEFQNLRNIISSQLPNVTVNVSGSVITEADLNAQITAAILQYQKNGQIILWSANP